MVPTPTLDFITNQLKDQESIPVGGRLRLFWRKWKAIEAPNYVVRLLRRGNSLPFKRKLDGLPPLRTVKECPAGLVSGYRNDPVKHSILLDKINELLVKKAIAPMPAESPGFFNRVFLVDKKGGVTG